MIFLTSERGDLQLLLQIQTKSSYIVCLQFIIFNQLVAGDLLDIFLHYDIKNASKRSLATIVFNSIISLFIPHSTTSSIQFCELLPDHYAQTAKS